MPRSPDERLVVNRPMDEISSVARLNVLGLDASRNEVSRIDRARFVGHVNKIGRPLVRAGAGTQHPVLKHSRIIAEVVAGRSHIGLVLPLEHRISEGSILAVDCGSVLTRTIEYRAAMAVAIGIIGDLHQLVWPWLFVENRIVVGADEPPFAISRRIDRCEIPGVRICHIGKFHAVADRGSILD